jgi:hypothetical protein
MIELLTADANLPFTFSLGLMALLAIIEGLGMLLGTSPSELVDSSLPDIGAAPRLELPEVGAPEIAGPEMGAPEASAHFGPVELLAWLQLGKVPFLIWLCTWLSVFGLFGLLIQTVYRGLAGGYLPPLLAAVAAVVGSLPVVRVATGLLARILPRDETTAVPSDSFVGRVATVTLGTARSGEPAQAKLKDQHGQAHYVMVEPDTDWESFVTGTSVLLVQRKGAVFTAIRNPSDALLD